MAQKMTLFEHLEEFARRLKSGIGGLRDEMKAGYAEKETVSELSRRVEAIHVPDRLGELTNDCNYQTEAQVDAKISAVYRPGGSRAFTALPSPAEGVLGMVYNVSDAFTTTAAFLEGAGREYPVGTNVAVVADGGTYKFDVLSGFVDLSGYVAKDGGKVLSTNDYTTAEKTKLAGIDEGATRITVDGELNGSSGNPVANKAIAVKFPIKTDDIADDAVTVDKLAAKSVGNEQLQLGSISNGKIQDKTITGGKLADKTVTGDKIAERTVGLSNLAPGSESNTVMVTVYENNQYETHWRKIDSSMIMDKQVQNADIADGTIVGSEKLKAKSVTGGRIADKTVGTDQLADKCINADKIQAGSVTQPKIQDKAVTKGKLDDEVANQLHTHDNKAVLDSITAGKQDADNAYNQLTIQWYIKDWKFDGEKYIFSPTINRTFTGKDSLIAHIYFKGKDKSHMSTYSVSIQDIFGTATTRFSVEEGALIVSKYINYGWEEKYFDYKTGKITSTAGPTTSPCIFYVSVLGVDRPELSFFFWGFTNTDLSTVGQLTGLRTADKSSIVAAINELAAKVAALS